MFSLIRRILGKNVRKRAKRGSPLWAAIGAISILGRLYRRFGRKREVIAYGEKLRPGEQLVLSHTGDAPRSLRKDRHRSAVLAAVSSARDLLSAQATGARRAAEQAEAEAERLRQEEKAASSRKARRRAERSARRGVA